jgi:hypothetical protein
MKTPQVPAMAGMTPLGFTDKTPAGPQGVIPGAARASGADMARRGALAPLRPNRAQSPCDVGLFSDDAAQFDLVDLTRRTK